MGESADSPLSRLYVWFGGRTPTETPPSPSARTNPQPGFRRSGVPPVLFGPDTKSPQDKTDTNRIGKIDKTTRKLAKKMTQNQQKMDQNRYKTTTKRTNGYRPDWITRTRPEPAPETKSTIIQKTKCKPDPGVGAHLYSQVCVRVCLSSHCKL